jgi:hypothetical protein
MDKFDSPCLTQALQEMGLAVGKPSSNVRRAFGLRLRPHAAGHAPMSNGTPTRSPPMAARHSPLMALADAALTLGASPSTARSEHRQQARARSRSRSRSRSAERARAKAEAATRQLRAPRLKLVLTSPNAAQPPRAAALSIADVDALERCLGFSQLAPAASAMLDEARADAAASAEVKIAALSALLNAERAARGQTAK